MKTKKQKQTTGYSYGADHGRPITRRDFVSQGLMSGLAISMVPSVLLAMFKSEIAEAAANCPVSGAASGLLPFVVLDMAGGLALPGNFITGKSLGATDYLNSYDTLGFPSANNPKNVSGQVDTRFGAPMHSVLSGFFQGMTATMSAGAMANTRIMTICSSSQDDTQANPLSPLILVAKAGLLGTVLPSGIGMSAAGPAGGNSSSPIIDSALKPFYIGSGSALVGAVTMGNSMSNVLTLSQKIKIAQAASTLSQGQFSKYQNMNQGSQFASLAECGYTKHIELMTNSAQVNASVNTNVQAVYASAAGDAGAAAVYNALMGNTGPGAVVVGGCDYHNQGQAVADAKDRECGVELGRIIELAHRLGKPVVVAGITDGGIAYATGTRNPQSDSGSRGLSFLACYKPTGAPTLVKSQIGAYTDGQGVDTTPFFSESPSMAAYILFANYLKICNRMDLFSTIVAPGAFPATEVNNILGFG